MLDADLYLYLIYVSIVKEKDYLVYRKAVN